MHKKGGVWSLRMQLIFAFSLIVVFAVFMVPMLKKIDVFRNTDIERGYMAKDLSFIIETTYASQGMSVIEYPVSSFWFSFEFENGKTSIIDSETGDKVTTRYFTDNNINFVPAALTPIFKDDIKKRTHIEQRVVPAIKKEPAVITVYDKELISGTELGCETIEMPAISTVAIDFNIGIHNDIELEDFEITASQLLHKIGIAIGYSIPNTISTKESFDSTEIPSLEKRTTKAKDADVVISLTVDNDEFGANELAAYYAYSEDDKQNKVNKKIACELLHAVDQVGLFDNTGTIPINLAELPRDDPKNILKAKPYGIYIVLGNTKTESWKFTFKDINEDPKKLVSKIEEALAKITK